MTQVAAAAERHVFHNRLTHSLEVAQIGRRLAQKLVAEQPAVAEQLGSIDPEVVEAAGLSHDIGHPPFGHAAEEELDKLATDRDLPDGFEGNAQTFRILTKLALRHGDCPGLNLTRATLNAVLKYPWYREPDGPHHWKFGAYQHTERGDFLWARQSYSGDVRRSAEAELMDWADDIAFAVTDMEDFYRAGLIPLDRLIKDDVAAERFLTGVFERWDREGRKDIFKRDDLKRVFLELIRSFSLIDPYTGTREQRFLLRALTADLIGRYIGAIRLRMPQHADQGRVEIEPAARMEIVMLKELTWHFVIKNPSLATQQHGLRRIINDLFNVFHDAAQDDRAIFPPRNREELAQMEKDAGDDEERKKARIRVVIDLIASLTEQQALDMHKRLTGQTPGSLLDVILR